MPTDSRGHSPARILHVAVAVPDLELARARRRDRRCWRRAEHERLLQWWALIWCLLLLLLTTYGTQAQVLYGYDTPGNLISQGLQILGAPVILRQPVAQVVSAGNNGSFSVLVADTFSVTYQWRFN